MQQGDLAPHCGIAHDVRLVPHLENPLPSRARQNSRRLRRLTCISAALLALSMAILIIMDRLPYPPVIRDLAMAVVNFPPTSDEDLRGVPRR